MLSKITTCSLKVTPTPQCYYNSFIIDKSFSNISCGKTVFIWISTIPSNLFSSLKFNKIHNSSLKYIKDPLWIKDYIVIKLFCQSPALTPGTSIYLPLPLPWPQSTLSGFTFFCLCLPACLSIYTCLANSACPFIFAWQILCLPFCLQLPTYPSTLHFNLCQLAFLYHFLSANILSAYLASQASSHVYTYRNT